MQVLIIDDHPLFRDGMQTLLTCLDPAAEVFGVSSVAAALSRCAGGIDLVLLDMNLPGCSHLDALKQITECCERASVVIVSAEDDPGLILRAIEAGAVGYIPKTTDQTVIINALRLVLAHGIYLPSSAVAHGVGGEGRSLSSQAELPELSGRQRAVLRLLLRGKSNKVIARELNVAEGTVKAHLWTVYQLLGVSSRVQAMYRVYELGMLPLLSDENASNP